MLIGSNILRPQTIESPPAPRAVALEIPRETFTRSQTTPEVDLSKLKLALQARPKEEPVPDIRGMLAENHRYSKLNLEINKAYVVMAGQFQDIYDPGRDLSPSWYAFAPFASRQAGNSIRMAEMLAERIGTANKPFQHTPEQEEALKTEFPDEDEREKAAIALALLGPNTAGNDEPEGILGNIRHLAVAAGRLKDLMKDQKGSLKERAGRIAKTARNMLEAGNKAIVSEIGVAGQDYLNFRKGKNPSPDEVLNNFTVEGTPLAPKQARRVFEEMKSIVESGAPLRTDWDRGYEPGTFDRSNFLVAGFAAYEAARLEPNKEKKNRWIEQAGTVIAFREQRDTVQSAFDKNTEPGEVSRKAVMEMGTPWVVVPTNDFDWSFRDYAEDELPPADDSKWTPRAAEYNWGDFHTRWGAILDFFGQVFEKPSSVWPMPDPDPTVPLKF